VHYELTGPSEAPTVALVHGALTPMFVWDALVPDLREAGLRVLRYDNYGRGFSDRPRARYDDGLYLRQLAELLDELAIERPVHLAGVSQGGAIATAYAARYPDEVDRLALMAPAGLPRPRRLPERLARLPGLGELVMHLAGPSIILRGLHHNVRTEAAVERLRPLIAEQMHFEGFRRSLLDTLRHFPMGGLRDDFEAVGRQDRAVFLLWGTADAVLPFELSKLARELIPQAEFHAIEGGGHIVHWEEPERVNPLLVTFLGAGADDERR
jgi:pimeloyl-ACP methyl ester carboxylesterase